MLDHEPDSSTIFLVGTKTKLAPIKNVIDTAVGAERRVIAISMDESNTGNP